jgi:hypothetical protein
MFPMERKISFTDLNIKIISPLERKGVGAMLESNTDPGG